MIRCSPLLALFAAQPAWACAVCFSGNDRGVTLAITIFLSLFPLALIGGGAWYLKRAADRLPPQPPRPAMDADLS